MEQERPDIDGLASIGLAAGIVVIAGLLGGRNAAIAGGTLVVLVYGYFASRESIEPLVRPRGRRDVEDAEGISGRLASIDAPPASNTTVASEPSGPAMGTDTAPQIRSSAPAMALPRIEWQRYALDSALLAKTATAITAIFFAWFFLTDLGDNPAGFFCDEAEIGLRARQFLSWDLLRGKNLFFYHHFAYSHMGSLPLVATAPFVLLFGLSDFSVRLASMVCAAAAVLLLIAFVRRAGWRYGEAGDIAFAASPIYLHFARINFGQSPSIVCVAAGLYCYARAKDQPGWRWPAAAGFAFALSVYGNGAYYLAAPVMLVALGIGELGVNRFARNRYRDLFAAGIAAFACWVPVLVKWRTDDNFMRRLQEKSGTTGSLFTVERLHRIIGNYGRYYSFDYLFVKGESGLPGGYITRHSVPGAGELQYLLLPLMAAGVVTVIFLKEPKTRLFGIMALALALLYPVPDAMATPKGNPPYTVTAFATMYFVPILAAIGVHGIIRWLAPREISYILRPRICGAILLGLSLFAGAHFFAGPYADYPNVSAAYYGWQYGPRQAVEAFERYRGQYDRYQMDGDFNEAYIFLDFYMYDDPELRQRTMIGGLFLADLSKHELMAVRAEKYNALMESNDPLRAYVKLKQVIYYPDGTIALYVLDVGYTNGTNRQNLPY